MQTDFDIAVIGGGLVGASFLIALAAQPREPGAPALKVVQIELAPPASPQDAGFPAPPGKFSDTAATDQRHLALNAFSWQTLHALGVNLSPAHCAPIRGLHISSQGDFGRVLLDAAAEGVAEFGRLVPANLLREALEARLASLDGATLDKASLDRQSRHGNASSGMTLTRMAQTKLLDVQEHAQQLNLSLATQSGPSTLSARYLIGADGTQSSVRSAMPREAVADDAFDYASSAISFNVQTETGHDGVAYERFTADGPIALLPLPKNRMGAVWTLPRERANLLSGGTDAEFLQAFQGAFGYRLGRLSHVGNRTLWPLQRFRAMPDASARAVLIGNAAQTIHPLGAQGFNLGLRDALALAKMFGSESDKPDLLAYSQSRRQDRADTLRFSDSGLVATQSGTALSRIARSIALTALDTAPLAKRALTRFGLGFVRGDAA